MSDEMTTYKRADGELIDDEFGWVPDLDCFDRLEDPVRVVREKWVRVESEELWSREPQCMECFAPLPEWTEDDLLLCAEHQEDASTS